MHSMHTMRCDPVIWVKSHRDCLVVVDHTSEIMNFSEAKDGIYSSESMMCLKLLVQSHGLGFRV